MKLLITGGAGFIGSNVIHHVIDRPEVARLVNLGLPDLRGTFGKPGKGFPPPQIRF